jgi:hypothetical protein
MGGVHCFTSISFSYLSRARVLGHSLRRFHPEWTLWLCITDREPEGYRFDIANEPFDHVVWGDRLDGKDEAGWVFKHDIVEACTAVKGRVLDRLLSQGADKVVYLDPDIAVFESLAEIELWLDSNDVLLTPHQLEPDETATAILDNEIGSLSTGIYNLGFLAVRNSSAGRRFATWWRDRLQHFCYDDRARGLFVDQRWCDLAPVFFEKVFVIRDPGYNVASWNLSRRKLSIDSDGNIHVNGSKLRFYHFTKLGPLGDAMTQRYAKDNIEIYEIWAWYRSKIEELATPGIPDKWWHYATFDNGIVISKRARDIYRQRLDLQQAFPDPFRTSEGAGYYHWLLTTQTEK